MNTEQAQQSQQVADASGQFNSNGKTQQYLTFMLGVEEYGVDILRVQEIKGWEAATEIPNTPDYIQGVMNLRGIIVPIIDLRTRFDLEKVEYGKTTVVIVLKVKTNDKERTMGFVVDAVADVYDVSDEQLKPPPDFGCKVGTEFVKGLATMKDKLIILLDIDHLVDASIMGSLDEQVA